MSAPGAGAGAPAEPVLDVDDLQGDALAGFRKDHARFSFLRIAEPPAARASLAAIVDRISPLRDVATFAHLFRSVRRRRGEVRGSISATWANVAFTATGLAQLSSASDVASFGDGAFRAGLAARSGLLGDPSDKNAPGHQSNWRFGGETTPVDAVLIVASDDPGERDATADALTATLQAGGWSLVYEESCDVRADAVGHEHFGFRDGISQPGPRGRLSTAEGHYLTPRLVDPSDARAVRFGRPGQPLIWPGAYVLGLPGQAVPPADDLQPLPAIEPSPAWARNGSYLVVRRLRQDVAAFRHFCMQAATQLAAAPGFAGMTPERLAAVLVGRWPSGAPVLRSPDRDDPALGADGFAANDFAYVNANPPMPLIPAAGNPPDTFPPAIADPLARICPHGSHIRKVNPRDEGTDIGGPRVTLPRLILRRGLPFGTSLPAGTLTDDGVERGLMFACYTASIENTFEFLSRNWANSLTAPRGHPDGQDLIIGQSDEQATGRARRLELAAQDGTTQTIATDVDWVTPTGGGYFFAPSISALRLLTA